MTKESSSLTLMLPPASVPWIRFRTCSQSIRSRSVYFTSFVLPLIPLFSRPALQNLVYTGTRGGAIVRWDTRTWSHNQKPFLSDRYKASSITNLRTIGRDRLLVGCIDGRLELFDLRYPLESTPITSFPGHVNSYSQKLVSQVSVVG